MEDSRPDILLSITSGAGNGTADVEHQRVRAGGVVYTSCHVSRQPEDTAKFGWVFSYVWRERTGGLLPGNSERSTAGHFRDRNSSLIE